jgi:chemotaxis protein methyltransferase CheR
MLAPADAEWLQQTLEANTAMAFDASRSDRMALRLLPVAKRAGLDSVAALIARARHERCGPLVDEILDALATHETSWFRDSHPWDTLVSTVVPEVRARLRGRRPIRIWSAACSTGQEPYTIALALCEALGPLRNQLEILASDFSPVVLARASEGRYTQLDMNRGVPAKLMLRHFRRDGAYWQVNDDLRRVVCFEQRNLARPFGAMAPMDVVCLRNVLIYFDIPVRLRILKEIARVIDPDGWLLLGSTETLLGLDVPWRPVDLGTTCFYRLIRDGSNRS